MSFPYGIMLDREWSEWAAKVGASPTVAAALFLISGSRPLPEIPAGLTPGELERVFVFACFSAMTTVFGSAIACSRAARFGVSPTPACERL
jgi:hypothetical protein